LPLERHDWAEQPAFALDAAAHWWFSRLILEPGRTHRSLRELRKNFTGLFVKTYMQSLRALIEKQRGDISNCLEIATVRSNRELDEMLTKLRLPAEVWPNNCHMWIYVRHESLEVIAIGSNDPSQQVLYPRFLPH
jgi:hypothetical protein